LTWQIGIKNPAKPKYNPASSSSQVGLRFLTNLPNDLPWLLGVFKGCLLLRLPGCVHVWRHLSPAPAAALPLVPAPTPRKPRSAEDLFPAKGWE